MRTASRLAVALLLVLAVSVAVPADAARKHHRHHHKHHHAHKHHHRVAHKAQSVRDTTPPPKIRIGPAQTAPPADNVLPILPGQGPCEFYIPDVLDGQPVIRCG